ncbi:hypothetical protein XINFAN_03171 [Pseudogemmobacter humi]|uniref:Uncharacterized protein n=1 Tax=Pseudogemmobacter humi TaxID=2483812 RepID=A0A3P5XAZ8_9RHOB|nr:hypothetical protein XINFAN_03171 [Pseudogemmobacter humi]
MCAAREFTADHRDRRRGAVRIAGNTLRDRSGIPVARWNGVAEAAWAVFSVRRGKRRVGRRGWCQQNRFAGASESQICGIERQPAPERPGCLCGWRGSGRFPVKAVAETRMLSGRTGRPATAPRRRYRTAWGAQIMVPVIARSTCGGGIRTIPNRPLRSGGPVCLGRVCRIRKVHNLPVFAAAGSSARSCADARTAGASRPAATRAFAALWSPILTITGVGWSTPEAGVRTSPGIFRYESPSATEGRATSLQKLGLLSARAASDRESGPSVTDSEEVRFGCRPGISDPRRN